MRISREKLRVELTRRLNLEEVKNLYFDFDLDPENQSTITKDGLIRELLKQLDARNRTNEFAEYLKEHRPDIKLEPEFAPNQSAISSLLSKTKIFIADNKPAVLKSSVVLVIGALVLSIFLANAQCFSLRTSSTLNKTGKREGPLIAQNDKSYFIWYEGNTIFIENESGKIRNYPDPETYDSRDRWVPLPNTPVSVCVKRNHNIRYRLTRNGELHGLGS